MKYTASLAEKGSSRNVIILFNHEAYCAENTQYFELVIYMIDHTSVNVKDYEKAKELYTKMLAPLGYVLGADMSEYATAGFKADMFDFWISQKESNSGTHVAFKATNKEQVGAFYEAGLEAGAVDNGAPGYRKEYSNGYYAAFLYDFDGNNIEAVWMDNEVE